MQARHPKRGKAPALTALCLTAAIAAALAGCGGDDDDNNNGNPGGPQASAPTLSVASSRADRASGGSALIDVALPADAPASAALKVTVNGADASPAFKAGKESGHMLGVVTGLKDGENTIVAKVGDAASTPLTVTNWPITGPISSGPHGTPFVCQTDTLALPDGTHLAAKSGDPDCSADTNVQFVYRTTADRFAPLTDTKTLPVDVKMITNAGGQSVPYVVRVETTTIDRGIAHIAMLFDPTKDAAPTPVTPPRNWNGRLVYGHGTGCPGGWYIQGGVWGYAPLNDTWLSRGYAVASNTLNHPTNSCNAVLSGEAASMTKEYFIKRYGKPAYTITTGTSGGAYSSLQLTDAFPGLFDGVFIDATFPDALAIAMSAMDGHLLTLYFASAAPSAASFTPAQKATVSGYAAEMTLVAAGNQMGRTDPVPGRTAPTFPGVANYASAVWNAAVPAALRYDPTSSPPNYGGARPTVFDAGVNVYGRAKNPLDRSGGSTYALRPFDNVGVQYGLAALNAGAISTTQFLDMNENIGGFDTDSNPITTRTTGDTGAMKRVYQSGLMLGGGGGLASVPIMDTTNIYSEDTSNYHLQWEHFAVRERLIQANGNADNQVMWRGDISTGSANAIAAFEKWMEAVYNDKSSNDPRTKAIDDKPADLVDGCFQGTAFTAEHQTLGTSGTQCNNLFPSYKFPRMQAGGPLAANIFKCQLKPVDPADYSVTFNAGEMTRLKAIFPNGVCDWSKPGVSQTPVVPWASVGPSTVNQIFDVTKP